MTTEKKAPDWERIEYDYRSGILSVREIAVSQGVSHVAIAKRAKKHGWDRDLSARIKSKADSLVTSRMVSEEVTKEQLVTEKQVVEAGALVIANIRLAHRKDINQSRRLAMTLLQELEMETGDVELFNQLGELMANPDDRGMDKLNEIYRKVISLPQRIDSVKKLSETLKNLITMEREAYGIRTGEGGEEKESPRKTLADFYAKH